MSSLQDKSVVYVTKFHGATIRQAFDEAISTVDSDGLTMSLVVDVLECLDFDMALGNVILSNFVAFELFVRNAVFQLVDSAIHPHQTSRLHKQQLVVYVALVNVPFSMYCPITRVSDLDKVYRINEGERSLPTISFRGIVLAVKSATYRIWCQTFYCRGAHCGGDERVLLNSFDPAAKRDLFCSKCQQLLVENGAQRIHTAHQEIQLMEAPQGYQNTSRRQCVKVSVAGEYAGAVNLPLGKLVEVIGIPELRLKHSLRPNVQVTGAIAIAATNMRVIPFEIPRPMPAKLAHPLEYGSDEDPWRFTFGVVRSFADQIVPALCFQNVKLGLLLSVVSAGSPPTDQLNQEGKQIRSQIHCLMTGSSGDQLQRLIAHGVSLKRHAIHITGKIVPSLTFTKYPNYVVEANSILLANDGICYIPHLWAINKQSELTLIPDAMEKQVMVVGKRDCYATVSGNTTIIACCPYRQAAEQSTLKEKIDLKKNAYPLLDCFDLCFNVENESDSDDSMIQMILRAHSVAAPEQGAVSFGGLKFSEAELTEILLAASKRTTKLGEPAHQLLQSYWLLLRKLSSGPSLKMMEVLIRCAMAHARLVGRPVVGIADCMIAIMLSEEVLVVKNGTQSPILHFQALPNGKRNIDTYGSTSAEQYQNFAKHVYQKLNSAQGLLSPFQKEE